VPLLNSLAPGRLHAPNDEGSLGLHDRRPLPTRSAATAVLRALALIAASLGAGCAGGSAGATRPTRPGAAVFASSCAGCHTLAPEGRSVPAPSGGSLLDYRMSAAIVASFARQMPLPRPLSAAELRAVAAYVADAQRRHAGSR